MALHVANERELLELAESLARAGLPRHLIIESDAPYEGQAMALGIQPGDRRTFRPLLRRYPLAK